MILSSRLKENILSGSVGNLLVNPVLELAVIQWKQKNWKHGQGCYMLKTVENSIASLVLFDIETLLQVIINSNVIVPLQRHSDIST